MSETVLDELERLRKNAEAWAETNGLQIWAHGDYLDALDAAAPDLIRLARAVQRDPGEFDRLLEPLLKQVAP